MIYSFSKLAGGGGSADLSGVVASADLSGTTLNLENNSGTTIDSVELSGITGDATVLEPKTALPASGDAGTVIALNKPSESNWVSFSAATQIGWTTIRGISSEDTWINLHLSPSDTWTRIGSYNGSGWLNSEYFLTGFTITWDGNNFTATNGSMNATGTTDGDNWQIEFDNTVDEVQDDWSIPSNDEIMVITPQEIGVYQANSAGTYENVIKDTTERANVLQAFPHQYGASNFHNCDIISMSDGRLVRVNGDQTGLNNFSEIAFRSDLSGFVSSTSVTTIWKGSQAEYDAIVSGGTIDNSTLYVIV